MALSATDMKTAIAATLATEFPVDGSLTGPEQTAFTANQVKLAKAIADALVPYLTTNTVVTVTAGIAVATTGTAAAQTGATTAPGTGTIA